MDRSPDELLREQMAYYRARAGEYDEWFLRQGRYDRGPALNQRWSAEVGEVARALAAFGPAGRVLELACGTGWWTQQLVRSAESLTAVDASAEVLALNEARVGDSEERAPGGVRYVTADLFTWKPDGPYDVVFFSFWLSHVPPERFEAFWGLVRSCLAPGGRVFFVDSRHEPTGTAADQRLEDPGVTTMTRRLNDGREFRIVKVFYEPDTLAARLESLGWRVTVQATESYFIYGFGERA
jgi:demethylmenaquinone methyltransferase/2-methoxy-6-polyprenyl-1,4-benzoquinol methylase